MNKQQGNLMIIVILGLIMLLGALAGVYVLSNKTNLAPISTIEPRPSQQTSTDPVATVQPSVATTSATYGTSDQIEDIESDLKKDQLATDTSVDNALNEVLGISF